MQDGFNFDAGAAIGAGINYFGQQQTNASNRQMAGAANELSYKMSQEANAFTEKMSGKQMDFQKMMSDTAYQRSTADMKAAGLNPMLAFSQGGASTPSGAGGSGAQGSVMASKDENALGGALSSALAVKSLGANISKIKSDKELNDAMIKTQKEQAALNISNAKNAEASAKYTETQNKNARYKSAIEKVKGNAAEEIIRSIQKGKDPISNALKIFVD